MSAIEASSVRLQTMSDGTLRIVCDVEPRHAQSAFRLFGAPGTPMALAALKPAQAEPEKPKGGVLSQWAALRCQEPVFWSWLARQYPARWIEAPGGRSEEAVAAYVIRAVCGVESRAEIDNDPNAEANFRKLIMGPWQRHCVATGVTT